MGTVCFPGIKRPGCGVDHTPHLALRLKKEYSYPPPLGLLWPVLGWTLPSPLLSAFLHCLSGLQIASFCAIVCCHLLPGWPYHIFPHYVINGAENDFWNIKYVFWFSQQILSETWIKIDQLDATCFTISLFTAQHVTNVSTSIFRSLRLIVDLFHVLYCSGSMCVGVTVWFGRGGVVSLCRLQPA